MLVPEVMSGALETAPELEKMRGSSELSELESRGKPSEGED